MAKQESGKTVVRRVKAKSAANSPADKGTKPAVHKSVAAKKSKQTTKSKSAKKADKPLKQYFFLFVPFIALGRYVRDSWHELRQVRWTNRRATWALTLAVILFSLFFIIFILFFDWLFSTLIREVIL